MPGSIFSKRLILVLGKGGVGRSTVAAAVASRCAASGRRTLLFEANANDRFASYFGAERVDTEIRQLDENLYAVNTNPTAAIAEYGLMVLRWKRIYNLVFENKIVKSFIRAVPGMDDYSIIGKAWYHTTEEKRGRPVWDTVVFDMPASGHSLSMLMIPKVITETVPEGPLTRDANTLLELLRDKKRTSLLLVTLAEDMPANEARELSSKLEAQLDLACDALIVNQLYPDRFPPGAPARAVLDALGEDLGDETAGDDIESLTRHARLAQARCDLQRKILLELASDLPLPRAELPLLFVERFGRAEIDALSESLSESLDAPTK